MREQDRSAAGIGTAQARTEPDSKSVSVQHARTEIRTRRTLSVERALVAVDYDAALGDGGHANTTVADGFLGVTESVVRRLRSGEKTIALAHLTIGPRDVFARVLVRAVVRAFGTAGARDFFDDCAQETRRASR